MAEEPQVYFCDITNESVPEKDLELGRAVQVDGKIIGASTVDQIRSAGAPPQTAPGGEGRLLPVALILLAAVAAATIFLDHRLTEETGVAKTEVERLVARAQDHDARFGSLDRALEATPKASAVKDLGNQLDAIRDDVDQVASRLGGQLDRQQQTVEGLQRTVLTLRDSQPDYMPTFDRLQSQIQQLAVDIAELRALPRAEPRDEFVGEATPPPTGGIGAAPGGLSAALAHQVARLADADPGTRFEAVDELLRSKNPEVRESLLPMTKDPDTFVRRLTVEGLRDFRHTSCVDALLVALADPEEIVRDTAWRSLKELTGQKLPFEATASGDARSKMQRRWQEWWDRNKSTFVGSS